MKKKILLCGLLVLSFGLWAQKGGGGVEYLYNLGADSFSSLSNWANDETWVIAPTATFTGAGGFGYGVDRNGTKTGGFGFAFWEEQEQAGSKSVPVSNGIGGGFGGVINGNQNRIGPFLTSINTRIGAGGISFGTGTEGDDGFFALFGSVDGELGIIVTPYLAISGYVGLSGIVGFPGPSPLVQGIPTSGVRVTWGSF